MQTYIALLRGINVGGHKKIPMVELREVLSNSGFQNAQTYIQSGNVIFQSKKLEISILENDLQKAIRSHFGFEMPIIVKTPSELQMIFDACPFSEEKKVNSYFTLLYTTPDASLIEEVAKITYPNEEFIIIKNCIYFYCSMGYGNAKYNNKFFERKLKTTATARNYKTMVKLIAMSLVNKKDH